MLDILENVPSESAKNEEEKAIEQARIDREVSEANAKRQLAEREENAKREKAIREQSEHIAKQQAKLNEVITEKTRIEKALSEALREVSELKGEVTKRLSSQKSELNEVSRKSENLLREQIAMLTAQSEKHDALIQKAVESEKAKWSVVIDEMNEQLQSTSQKVVEQDIVIAELKSKVVKKAKLPTVLDLINYSEMIVVTWGLYVLFGKSGLIASLPANFFYYDTMRTVKAAKSWDSANFARMVIFFLSAIFVFIHFNTFSKTITSTDFNPFWVSVVGAVALSGISWAAINQSFLKKEDGV